MQLDTHSKQKVKQFCKDADSLLNPLVLRNRRLQSENLIVRIVFQ